MTIVVIDQLKVINIEYNDSRIRFLCLGKPKEYACKIMQSHSSIERFSKYVVISLFFELPFPFISFPPLHEYDHRRTSCDKKNQYNEKDRKQPT